jgi:hypothetical protein
MNSTTTTTSPIRDAAAANDSFLVEPERMSHYSHKHTQKKRVVGAPVVPATDMNSVAMDRIERYLEREKQQNKMESWTKLDKIVKSTKLRQFVQKIAPEQNMSMDQCQRLESFLLDALEQRTKLQKSKDIVYNKDLQAIVDIPGLVFPKTMDEEYSWSNTDQKRLSTLKFLTPKRMPSAASTVVDVVAAVALEKRA